ncbi:UreF, putative [Synechococcus sp. PCC 7335]|uniref:urease accessory protein UreF n=1 Tax=Synechococcus sp. (strain ATCC 29403 / PCC 7335) TaxID=91464 RepID=UPI00017ED5F7|nr:urease accessory UreF family protein [Synechococcus sp. PCC 7335]EDX86443.1 UreF, putative [Synechococcus sp. PCC 7335]
MHTDPQKDSLQSIVQQFTLMQLADSFFPSGSYTLSHGLESLVQEGRIKQSEDVETFIRLLLCNKVGTTDLVALAHTHRASAAADMAGIVEVDALLFAQTPIEKTRVAQRQSGRALLMVASKTWPHSQLEELGQRTAKGQINCLHPVVFAVVAQVAGLDERSAMTAFIHGFVTGLLGAAIRLGAVGHLQAQKIRLDLAADMATVCEEASELSLDEMWSCTPLIDIAQMRQAKLSRRLFAS